MVHRGGLCEPTLKVVGIEDTDVVLWYVFGIHHMTRPEEWPVMPVDSCGFTLKPLVHKPVEQHNIGEVAFVFFIEQVAHDRAARRDIGIKTDESDTRVVRFDMGCQERIADCAGASVP